jgi:hypothetical protein
MKESDQKRVKKAIADYVEEKTTTFKDFQKLSASITQQPISQA